VDQPNGGGVDVIVRTTDSEGERQLSNEQQTQQADDPSGPGWRDVEPDESLRYGDLFRNVDHWQATQHAGQPAVDERTYRRRIEPQPEPESDTELQAQVAFLKGREVTLGTRLQQEREVTTRLRHELKTVQNQLAAVKAELASVAADRQRLRVELDAAQQVPADSPELRQLRADLAEVTQDRDTYRHAHELLVNDVNATHQRAKVMTIEAIVEWLVPIRTCGSQALATAVVSNLPHIMRSLTGLADEEIE